MIFIYLIIIMNKILQEITGSAINPNPNWNRKLGFFPILFQTWFFKNRDEATKIF